MMIPGAWEARRRSDAAADVLNVAPPVRPPASQSAAAPPVRAAERAERPGWVQAVIFAATLLAAMGLAMTAFF